MPWTPKLCRAAVLGTAVLGATAATFPVPSPARGDVLDLSMPRTVIVGAPRGAAPSERFDPRRTGRSRTRLPAVPVELWRRHVSGSIDLSPVVDDTGNIVVALTIPEIVKLGPDAREQWRARLGNSAPLAPPTLLSDGTVAVVTAAGVAWGLSPRGAVRFSTPLGIPRRDADTAPLALSDGGLLVAAGNVLVEIDSDGVVRARTALDERAAPGERAAGAVIEGPGPAGGALITTVSGYVYRFRPPAQPRRIGSFGGATPRGAALADDRTLLAVVDSKRLVALDLPTGTAHVRTSGLALDGPPAVSAPDDSTSTRIPALAMVGTQLGMLLGVDALGNERTHAMLDKLAVLPAGSLSLSGSFVQVELKPSPPVVVDAVGRVAFVRFSGRAGVVAPDGHVEIASERVCAAPVAVLPGGEKRMLVACHDGGLWMYGE